MRVSLDTQLKQAWDYVSATIGEDGYLVGDALTLADIQMVYVVAVASATGALRDHPRIEAYLQRLMANPALARAMATGGPMV